MRRVRIVVILLLLTTASQAIAQEKWSEIKAPDSSPNWPQAREGHGMVYMSDSKKIFLFGGYGADGYLNDTWVFDVKARSWEKLSPINSPAPRANFAMAYDSDRKAIILHGGEIEQINDYGFSHEISSQTWEWNGKNWQLIKGSFPSKRSGHAMAYDTKNKRMVMFAGGYNATDYWSDSLFECDQRTYEYIKSDWREMPSSLAPRYRYAHAMTSNTKTGKIYVSSGAHTAYNDIFGELSKHIFSLSTNDGWLTIANGGPGARVWHSLEFNSKNDRVYSYGGGVSGWVEDGEYEWDYFIWPQNDLWRLDGNQWSLVKTIGNKPSKSMNQGFVFDDYNGVFWVFGGRTKTSYNASSKGYYESDFSARLHYLGELKEEVEEVDLMVILVKFNPINTREAGDEINYLFRIRNKSNFSSGFFSVAVYLSLDKELDDQDIQVSNQRIEKQLKPRHSNRFRIIDTVHEDIPADDYYLIVKVLAEKPDKNLDNNIRVSKGRITIE